MSSAEAAVSTPGGAYAGGHRPKVVVLSPWGRFGDVGEQEILERAGCDVVVTTARSDADVIAAVRDADAIIPTWGLKIGRAHV